MEDDKPKNYRELLQQKQGGVDVDAFQLQLWRREEELLFAAICEPEKYRDCGIKPAHMSAPTHAVAWRALLSLFAKDPALTSIIPGNLVSEMCFIDESLGGRAHAWVDLMLFDHPVDAVYGRQEIVGYLKKHNDIRNWGCRFSKILAKIGRDSDVVAVQTELVTAAHRFTHEIDGEGAMEKPLDETDWSPFDDSSSALVKTGISFLDRAAGGGHGRGELLVWGGGTGTGKSFSCQHLLRQQAKMGSPVLYISLEDSKEVMLCRMISDFTTPRMRSADVRERRNREGIVAAMSKMKSELNGLVHVVERKKATISQVCDIIRSYRYIKKVNMVVVDYLQAVREDQPVGDKMRETSSVISKLKQCFTECQVAGVVMSQFSREDYKNSNEPGLNSCKYAGDIENEAEIMVVMWKDENGALHAKLPKLKWGNEQNLKFLIRRDEVTGCHVEWQEDHDV